MFSLVLSVGGAKVWVVCYLCTRGSRWWEETFWFSLRRGPFCWGRGWWRCLWTTCCCRWSQRAWGSPASGSSSRPRGVPRRGERWEVRVSERRMCLCLSQSRTRTWSYSDIATQKIMAVTSSKQWIHFFRSDRCPPTSNSLKLRFLKEKWTSTIPVVFTRVRRMSCSVGW